jgi:hypothetical protein
MVEYASAIPPYGLVSSLIVHYMYKLILDSTLFNPAYALNPEQGHATGTPSPSATWCDVAWWLRD